MTEASSQTCQSFCEFESELILFCIQLSTRILVNDYNLKPRIFGTLTLEVSHNNIRGGFRNQVQALSKLLCLHTYCITHFQIDG
jgi:hypothetical protein